jgi:hypothetical protein
MPFKSLAQEGYMHEHPEILGKKGLAEWDAATRGTHPPERVHNSPPHEFSNTPYKLAHKPK